MNPIEWSKCLHAYVCMCVCVCQLGDIIFFIVRSSVYAGVRRGEAVSGGLIDNTCYDDVMF